MYGCRRHPGFRQLGHFVPVADDSWLRPETQQALLKIHFTSNYISPAFFKAFQPAWRDTPASLDASAMLFP